MVDRCRCIEQHLSSLGGEPIELHFHLDEQDTECEAWKELCGLVDLTAKTASDRTSAWR